MEKDKNKVQENKGTISKEYKEDFLRDLRRLDITEEPKEIERRLGTLRYYLYVIKYNGKDYIEDLFENVEEYELAKEVVKKAETLGYLDSVRIEKSKFETSRGEITVDREDYQEKVNIHYIQEIWSIDGSDIRVEESEPTGETIWYRHRRYRDYSDYYQKEGWLSWSSWTYDSGNGYREHYRDKKYSREKHSGGVFVFFEVLEELFFGKK